MMERSKNNRLFYGVLLLLTLIGLGRVFHEVYSQHAATVYADPYTYVTYAKNLADGHFYIESQIGELISEHYELPEGKKVSNEGPIWNTSILHDGKVVYTVGVGYPLWLAVLWRIGGTVLAVYSNFLVWPVLLTLLFLLVYEGLGRSRFAAVSAVCTCLLVPTLDYQTFNQMCSPWREPLFISCLLGASYCVLLCWRRKTLLPGLLMAVLFGYAAAIKEANVIYAPALGLLLIFSPAFRGSRRKPLWLVLLGLCFFIGLSPLLYQNFMATGNPFTSLQTMRATGHYDLKEAGAGLSLGNAGETIRRYKLMFGSMFYYQIPFVVAALFGLGLMLKRKLGWMVGVMLLVHLALYLQWGNADHRHMYFATMLYAICLAVFPAWLLEKISRRTRPSWIGFAPLLLPLILVLNHPDWHWGKADPAKLLSASDAKKAVAEIVEKIEEPALLFVNRNMRDLMACYSDVELMRLQEFSQLQHNGGYEGLMDELIEHGLNIYFLDNTDKDPKNAGRYDLAVVDTAMIRHHHDLIRVAEFPVKALKLQDFHDHPTLNLYQVKIWTQKETVETISVPPEGVAFLELNPGSLGDDLEINFTDGSVTNMNGNSFLPLLTSFAVSTNATIRFHAHGELVPGLLFPRLVGWYEKIMIDFGFGTALDDASFFQEAIGEPGYLNHRRLAGDIKLKLPVRSGDDLFTLMYCSMYSIPIDKRNKVKTDHIPSYTLEFQGKTLPFEDRDGVHWVVFDSASEAALRAEKMPVTITPPEGYVTKLNRISLQSARRHAALPLPTDAVGLSLVGTLVLDGSKGSNYVMNVNGKLLREGIITNDPRFSANHLSCAISSTADVVDVRLQGAGLIKLKTAPILPHILIAPDKVSKGCMGRSFYNPERDEEGRRYCWSRGVNEVLVPLTTGTTSYKGRLTARSGKPFAETVQLRLEIQGVTRNIEISNEVGESGFRFDIPSPPSDGIYPLKITADAWRPSELIDSGDNRELGFQFYELEWMPEDLP